MGWSCLRHISRLRHRCFPDVTATLMANLTNSVEGGAVIWSLHCLVEVGRRQRKTHYIYISLLVMEVRTTR